MKGTSGRKGDIKVGKKPAHLGGKSPEECGNSPGTALGEVRKKGSKNIAERKRREVREVNHRT